MLISVPAVMKRSRKPPDHEVVDHVLLHPPEESLGFHTTTIPYDISFSKLSAYRSLSK